MESTAPEPKPKKNRELKTQILPVEIAHSSGVLTPPPASPTEEVSQQASLNAAVEKLKIDPSKVPDKPAAPAAKNEPTKRDESVNGPKTGVSSREHSTEGVKETAVRREQTAGNA